MKRITYRMIALCLLLNLVGCAHKETENETAPYLTAPSKVALPEGTPTRRSTSVTGIPSVICVKASGVASGAGNSVIVSTRPESFPNSPICIV